MSQDRPNDRHGQNAPPTVVRYEVYFKCSEFVAQAYTVWFEASGNDPLRDPQTDYVKADDFTSIRICVWAVDGTTIGDVGDRGWAMFNEDSHRWEKIYGAGERAADTSTTSTSTTTTGLPSCGSTRCKHTWSASSSSWTLTENNCANETTTSTTTSTTTAPCCPDANTTTTSSTTAGTSSTTSTTSTTTTTPPACHCDYPKYCGSTDGECTHTDCVSGVVVTQVDCTTTTTAPSTTTLEPTTTPDCNTTTTPPDCGSGCHWRVDPFGNIHKISGGCGPTCFCLTPDTVVPCATAFTPCQSTAPGSGPADKPCTGVHHYVCGIYDTWEHIETGSGCETNARIGGVPVICTHVPPSGTCTCGAFITVSCQAVPPTTGPPIGPCYTTVPATTSSTTTTTGPCSVPCGWTWDTGTSSWTLSNNPCGVTCHCPQPAVAGTGSCSVETVKTPCIPSYTTTTSGPTTTTAPTTTTTTTSTTTTSTTTTTTSTTTTTTTTSTTTTGEPTTTTTTSTPCYEDPSFNQACGWKYVSGSWVLQAHDCQDIARCLVPGGGSENDTTCTPCNYDDCADDGCEWLCLCPGGDCSGLGILDLVYAALLNNNCGSCGYCTRPTDGDGNAQVEAGSCTYNGSYWGFKDACTAPTTTPP